MFAKHGTGKAMAMTADPTNLAEHGAAARRRFLECIVILLLGVTAGLQLGKIAPVVGLLQHVHGHSLTAIGWLTALIGLFVALAALPTAKLVDRIGALSATKIGAVVLTAGAWLLPLFDTLALQLTARTVEAVGYVLLVITAPAYLVAHAVPGQRPMMLALWGSFVPVGYALANIQANVVVTAFGHNAFLFSAALPLTFLTLAALLWVHDSETVREQTQTARPDGPKTSGRGTIGDAVLLAACFGVYVLLSLGFFTFLPAFAERTSGTLPPATVALFVPAGNMLAAFLLALLSARHAPLLVLVGFAFSAFSALFLFHPAETPALLFYLAFAFLGGLIASAVFGSVPQAASPNLPAVLVIGMIAQAGGLGTLAGPPLAGFVLDTLGWHALTGLLTGLSVLGAMLVLPILFRSARMRPP